jgi:hypothetical protein
MTGAPHSRTRSPFVRALYPAVITLLVIGLPATSLAQPGMGPGPVGPGQGPVGPAGGPGQRREKKEGPAEEAPKDKEALRPIETVPAQPSRVRRLQLFELHGYMRTRADYFHRLNMGLHETPPAAVQQELPTRFFRPPAEMDEYNPDVGANFPNDARCENRLLDRGVSPQRAQTRCGRRHGFGSANMRLRLEPTLHISDTIKAHAQIDLLDNVVLGSTPDSYAWDDPWAPLDIYSRTQTPPHEGRNSFTDSVVAKRAWGDMKFGWGLRVMFGRMPWSWGMGLVANHGMGYYRGEQADIIRYVDQDYGDSVDSVRLSYDFGKDRRRTHTLALSWDWAATGPTTSQLLGPQWRSGGNVGQDFSAERFDNVHQWSISIERRDEPEMLERKLSLGNPVLNWGLIAWLRYQDVDSALGHSGLGSGLGTNPEYYDDAPFPDTVRGGGATLGNGEFDAAGRSGLERYSAGLMHRRAMLATPDAWLRVNWRTLRVELELAGTFGTFRMRDLEDQSFIDDNAAFDGLQRQDLQRRLVANFGYALEFKYGFFKDRFHIGFDHGLATGDSSAALDYNSLSPLSRGNDTTLTRFRFNPAYNVDLLMFRQILGTVSNATYFKPWAAFYFFDHFSARVDVEYAMAMQRQATLGNRWSYGIELDGALRYHDAREPVFLQVQYGVMFPLPGFNRLNAQGGRDNARAVQTVQGQIGIRF